MGYGHYGMGWMMGGFWWIFPLLFLICIIVGLYLIFGRRNPYGTFHSLCGPNYTNSKNESETPLEILKKRYAKGEITKEEFEKMKKDILN